MSRPIFRFAPSPNGELHLGHAYSALLNQQMARAAGGPLLLRIEDIDTTRCTPEFERAMLEDLRWIGFHWDGEPRRQSQNFANYENALKRLREDGLIYPAFMTRGELRAFVSEQERDGRPWPRDPDGAPMYPSFCRQMSDRMRREKMESGEPFAWRLDMTAALARVDRELEFYETGAGPGGETGMIAANPAAWGDVILARKETPTSYHLAVTVDDAAQGVTHVVRGRDLFAATSVHRLLQTLLGLPQPIYHHHRLLLDDEGRKLSKSLQSTGLRALREAGRTPQDVCARIDLPAPA
ncbi:MAG TPA: tRNA glutamyl-Q(34) synthetase GluQRS [Rhizobiaceae bacterium]|nr:tRNA glutamyl-Q(34) synthetase GluQRS [Rhizobiaceae bacterium]